MSTRRRIGIKISGGGYAVVPFNGPRDYQLTLHPQIETISVA
jgi:hypothetical protein